MRERMRLDPAHRSLIREALVQGCVNAYRVILIKDLTDEWLAESTADPRPYFWRGIANQHFAGHKEDWAIADYNAALAIDPDYDEARERLAALLLKKGSHADARKHFQILSERRPDDPMPLVGLARCLIAHGQYEPGRNLLDRVLTMSPDHPAAMRERGILAMLEGRPDEAEPMLRKACAAMPQDITASYNLYLCLDKLGRKAEAEEHLKRHHTLDAQLTRLNSLMREYNDRPTDPEVLFSIGAIYLSLGSSDKEITEHEVTGLMWMQRTLDVAPRHKKACAALADFYQRKEMPKLADRFRAVAQ
jgi:tetratricopeptide (TPR) repeat protein